MHIVTTPTRHWLEQSVELCSSRFLVASPYIGSFLTNITDGLPGQVEKLLLTRTDLRDFVMGSSDLDALCSLSRGGTEVLSLAGLHAKMYVVDNSRALITSANATMSGMNRNWECGVAFDDPVQVAEIADLVLTGFGVKPKPQSWNAEEIEMLREPVQTLREQLPPSLDIRHFSATDIGKIKLKRASEPAFVSAFTGWTQLALEGVMAQPDAEFSLDSLMGVCLPLALERFPNNRYVREQIRKQLQRLRDLGIVEFVGGGRYRRLIES